MKRNHPARVRACASERVSMWLLVFACASFRCFCVFGLGVHTHRCWYEDSSSGCGFHEERSDQQEFSVEHNRVGEVVLVLRHKDRVGCHTTYMPPTSLPIVCPFLDVSCHVDAYSQFHILLRRVPPQSVQVFGRVRVQFVFLFWFRHFI